MSGAGAAAADREQARQDRSAGTLARILAAADRRSAGRDRARSASDRGTAGRDRTAALGDREAGDDERTCAVLLRSCTLDDCNNVAADRQSASLDELTGAYLRHPGLLQLERDLSRAQRNGESLVVAFIDVDQLKAANGRGGHKAGDRLLQDVARTLQAHLRQHDLIICLGGDEFVCVVAGLDRDDVTCNMAMRVFNNDTDWSYRTHIEPASYLFHASLTGSYRFGDWPWPANTSGPALVCPDPPHDAVLAAGQGLPRSPGRR